MRAKAGARASMWTPKFNGCKDYIGACITVLELI